MLQLATPPARPRSALLASVGIHVLACSAFGLGPLLVFPEAPGWRGEVRAYTQPDLSFLREGRTVDLRGRRTGPRPVRAPGRPALPAVRRDGPAPAPAAPAFQPGPILPELPTPPDEAPLDGFGGPDGDGEPAGDAPWTGGDGGRDGYDGGPIDVRGGGEVPPDVVLPVPLRTPSPGYSDAARIARAAGTVVLSATIAADGSVVDVTVENDPSPLLARLAVDAVSRWRYVPARIGTRPVAVILRVKLTFRLV